MSLSINPLQYQNMQAASASANAVNWAGYKQPENFDKKDFNLGEFGRLTGSVKGIDNGLFTKGTTSEITRPVVDVGLIARLDRINSLGPEGRDAQHGQHFYTMA
ncbi:hypothetical protein IJ182_08510 [bacterium]|nr:hypothetical protein [bacterium]